MDEEISGMLALYPDEEVERASRCHGHQQKVIAIRHEFDTCPVPSTHLKPRLSVGSPGFSLLRACIANRSCWIRNSQGTASKLEQRKTRCETDEGMKPLVATVRLVTKDEQSGVSCRLTSKDRLRHSRLATWDCTT